MVGNDFPQKLLWVDPRSCQQTLTHVRITNLLVPMEMFDGVLLQFVTDALDVRVDVVCLSLKGFHSPSPCGQYLLGRFDHFEASDHRFYHLHGHCQHSLVVRATGFQEPPA